MNGRIFLDTNVLVYAYDRSEPVKQERALAVMEELAGAGLGFLSTQILAEMFVALTQKIRQPLSSKEAAKRVEHHMQIWTVVGISSLIVLEALRGVRQHRFQYWDAQIWAAARINQALVLLSEDFADGAVVEGLRFANPFASGFQLADWM